MDKTFHIAQKRFNKIKKIFPKYKMFVSGHSLGGSKALYVSQQCNDCVKGVVFNSFIPVLKTKLIKLVNNTNNVTKFVFNTLLDFHTINQYVDPDKYLSF